MDEQAESALVIEKAKAALLDKVGWTTPFDDRERVSRMMDHNTLFDKSVAEQVLMMLRKVAVTTRFSEDERIPEVVKHFPLDQEAENRAHIEFFTVRAGVEAVEKLVIKVDKDALEAAQQRALGKGINN